jgi:hypothetical protein
MIENTRLRPLLPVTGTGGVPERNPESAAGQGSQCRRRTGLPRPREHGSRGPGKWRSGDQASPGDRTRSGDQSSPGDQANRGIISGLCLVGRGFNPAENDAVASLPFAPFQPRELSVARVTNHVSAALKTAALHLNLVALRALALTRTLFVRGKIQIEIRGMGESDGQKGILDCLLPIGF